MDIVINHKEVINLINNIKNGQMFSIFFERVAAKCETCQKSDKKWNQLEVCPICGTNLSKERKTVAMLGVQNPSNCTKPGQGMYIGESGDDALKEGRLKYFNPNVINRDQTKGCYRQCKIELIKRLIINHQTYNVAS